MTVTTSDRSATSLNELAALLAALSPRVIGDGEARVTGVRQDSRRVEPGELFVARRGGKMSGASYAEQAASRGAAALLVERGDALPLSRLPILEVTDVKLALALAAEAVYGNPSRALDVVGVTGTNGKTTTTFLIEQALNVSGSKPARLGTLGFEMGGETFADTLTTPEADDIARCLLEVQRRGGSHLVMEVSSIALAQRRVAGLRFRVAAFTNLTQDHLDFHGTLEAYAEAKAELFCQLSPERSVIHVGDAFGKKLAARVRSGLITVGLRDADVRVASSELSGRGLRAAVVTPFGECELTSALVGEHNLENLLVALGVLLGLGMAPEHAGRALSGAPQVPGRLERCEGPDDDLLVAVDYAHTPDALARALGAMRSLGAGRVVCVFGCGGDRDPKKRAPMGEAVARGADYAFVTSDNPRSESPQAIVDQILPGLRAGGGAFEVELDRALAIEKAIASAQPGDLVLIAGKGHEDYQIVGAEKRHFDDREQARHALALRRQRSAKSP